MRREPWVWWLIALVLGASVALLVVDLAGGIGGFQPDWRWASFIWMLALAVWIGPSVFANYRGRSGNMLRGAAVWLGIALVFALLYVYRHELGLPID